MGEIQLVRYEKNDSVCVWSMFRRLLITCLSPTYVETGMNCGYLFRIYDGAGVNGKKDILLILEKQWRKSFLLSFSRKQWGFLSHLHHRKNPTMIRIFVLVHRPRDIRSSTFRQQRPRRQNVHLTHSYIHKE